VLLHKRADVCIGQYIKVVDKALGLVDNNKSSVSLLLETVNVLTLVEGIKSHKAGAVTLPDGRADNSRGEERQADAAGEPNSTGRTFI
jgi:hypothetical protein